MSTVKTIGSSDSRLSSTVFPTDEDMKLWNSFTPEERQAFIIEAEENGFQSGVAPAESVEERLARVRAEAAHEL